MPLLEHHQFIENALSQLQADSRIVGVAVGGSWLSDSMDRFSDIDLVVAVEPDAFAAVMGERKKIAGQLGNMIAAFTGEHVGEPRLLICLYDAPLLHVDLKFVSLPNLAHRVEDPFVLWERDERLSQLISTTTGSYPPLDLQWIEDRFWIMTHYGALKIGRGELFEAISMLDYLRTVAIGPLLHVRHGGLPRGVRHLESVAPETVPTLVETLAIHDSLSCANALLRLIDLYRELRAPHLEAGALVANTEAENAVTRYVREIRTAIEEKQP